MVKFAIADIGEEFGDVRPLDEARIRKLSVNGIQLLDRIDADVPFVSELAAVGCITWPQRQHLMNITQPRDRNDKLLEFLTRRSVDDFQKFINVLAKEQAHLVPLLLTDGGETSSKNINLSLLLCLIYVVLQLQLQLQLMGLLSC